MADTSAEKDTAQQTRTSAQSSAAYFLSIRVENVRCFGPEQTLDLSDGEGRPARWTVILGDNGTGKTTLLQALAAMEPRLFKMEPIPVIARFAKDVTLSDWKPWRGSGGEEDAFSTIRVELCTTAGLGEHEIKESCKLELHPDSRGYHRGSGLIPPGHSKDVGGLTCYAYGASRRMGKTGLLDDEPDDPTASLFSDNVPLPNAEEWLLQADYTAQKASGARKEKAEKRLERVKDILLHILPDVDRIRIDVRDSEETPRVEFQTPYGWVTLDRLGLGYRTMIAWTVDLARRLFERYPNSRNPLEEPAVVLVDEIDLHLHPKWQRDIIRFLSERFPNTQFIVTAHSPLVVQAAQDANIAVLRREGDHVVIEQDLQPLRNLRIDQILTSELYGLESARPPHLDDLLKERRDILSKSTLTASDKKRLKVVEEQIGELPAGETPEEMEAMDIIRRAAEQLKPSE